MNALSYLAVRLLACLAMALVLISLALVPDSRSLADDGGSDAYDVICLNYCDTNCNNNFPPCGNMSCKGPKGNDQFCITRNCVCENQDPANPNSRCHCGK